MKTWHMLLVLFLFALVEVAVFHVYLPPEYDTFNMNKRNALEHTDKRPCSPAEEDTDVESQPNLKNTRLDTPQKYPIQQPTQSPPQQPLQPTQPAPRPTPAPTAVPTPAPTNGPKKEIVTNQLDAKSTPPPKLTPKPTKPPVPPVVPVTKIDGSHIYTPEEEAERKKVRDHEKAIAPKLTPTVMLTNPKLPSVPATTPGRSAIDAVPKSKADIVKKNYDNDIANAQARYKEYEQTWNNNTQFSCFKNADLPCRRLPNLPGDLPAKFADACEPIFSLMGTPKSGTTSFYYYIIQHPQVNQALSGNFNKEVRFFSEYYNKGTGWFLQQFPPVTPHDISFPSDNGVPRVRMANGEASPTYSYHPDVPSRIKATSPDMKLIMLMADPVKRAYSEKMMYVNNRQIFKRDVLEDVKYQIDNFNKCWNKEFKNFPDQTDLYFKCLAADELTYRRIRTPAYVINSIYVHQIRNFLRYFPREQILFLKSEDLYEKPEETMKQITDFIGLCPIDWTDIVKVAYNRREKRYDPMTEPVKTLLTNFYKNYTYQFYDELGIDWEWESA